MAGLADAHIVLTDLSSQIGREEPNKVTLSGNAKVNISSLFGPQQANMTLKMKAQPVFNKEKARSILQDMELVDVRSSRKKCRAF